MENKDLNKCNFITVNDPSGDWDGSQEDGRALQSWDKDLKTGDGALKAQRPFDLKAI